MKKSSLFLVILAYCLGEHDAMTTYSAPTTPAVPTPIRLRLEATPQEIIPGLTPSLDLVCGPGRLAYQYRQIFLIQLLTSNGFSTPLPMATLLPGQAPKLVFNISSVTASGQLDNLTPETASLNVHIEDPSIEDPLKGGRVFCKVVGLGTDGSEVTHEQFINITTHPESGLVDMALKEMVANLKKEADALLAQTKSLQQENLLLAQITASKQQAVVQKRADLQQLKLQVDALEQTVADREITLNQTALELVDEVANVTKDAPAMRVSFNAAERTSRVYANGAQIQFDTVEMNEGNGYNNSDSVFRPPVDGVYYLTSAQLVHDLGASYRAYSIRVNSTVVAGATNADDRQASQYKHSSTSAVVYLTPNDMVRVYQQYSSSASSTLDPYSNTPNGLSTNFAGYLMC